MAEARLGLREDFGYTRSHIGGIYEARRIVRRVHQHDFGMGGQGALESVKVGKQGPRFEGNLNQVRAPIFDEHAIGGVIRKEGDHFIGRVEHRLHEGVDRRRRTGGHDDIACGIRRAETASKRFGNSFANGRVTGTFHIPMQLRAAVLGGFAQSMPHCSRTRRRRIADAEIEYVISTVRALQLFRGLEGLTNRGASAKTLRHEPGNEHVLLSARMQTCAHRAKRPQ